MVNQNVHIREPKPTLAMQPKKFALWLFIVSIVMLFAALTSAYIVKQADGNWLSFELPGAFLLSTGIIALSSFTMHLAYLAAKKRRTWQGEVHAIADGRAGSFIPGDAVLFLVAARGRGCVFREQLCLRLIHLCVHRFTWLTPCERLDISIDYFCISHPIGSAFQKASSN
jgi:uncharacterized membrane protein YhdT